MKARNGREIPGPGISHEHDLWLLAHGYETGWWDEKGVPAPWPEDFPDGWTPTTGPPTDPHLKPGEPPF
jgi:hypothetical protein